MDRRKFVCICSWGHCRSVALAKLLHERGHDAVAIGTQRSGTAAALLCEWADIICTLQPQFAEVVPAAHRGKIVCLDVGPDVWSNPYNQDLRQLLGRLLDGSGVARQLEKP